MGQTKQKIQINGRPIMLASYVKHDIKSYRVPIRIKFPQKGESYMGGFSDGYIYRSVFAGSSLNQSYEMVKSFLQEEGYGDIPIPKDDKELLLFQLNTRNKQVLLFEDNGYVHNPIKILFPIDRRKKHTLELFLYNESGENHLLKFHNKDDNKSTNAHQ